MDKTLGKLFKAIEELNLGENTYIFFMSDNGWFLGEHGFTSKVLPYRPSTHVPFFVVGPGIQPQSNESLVLNIDLAPTILELAGVDPPIEIHGKSIVPLLKENPVGWRKSFVYEGLGTYGNAKPNLTVITHTYRYIETYENEQLDNVIFRELYDQINDPDEMNNLIFQGVKDEILKEFQEAIEKT